MHPGRGLFGMAHSWRMGVISSALPGHRVGGAMLKMKMRKRERDEWEQKKGCKFFLKSKRRPKIKRKK